MSYAPWWRCPLTKNVGVPDTRPRSAPSPSLGDPLRRNVPSQVLGEARHVEPESVGVRRQIGHPQLVLVLEQPVVHLPERALIGGGLRGQCRQLGVRMHVCERQVPLPPALCACDGAPADRRSQSPRDSQAVPTMPSGLPAA